jgi:protein SCO1/2
VTRLRFLLLAIALAGSAAPAAASLTPEQLASVGVRPPLDAAFPLGAPLTDIDGHATTLGAAIADRPTLVIFADYDCPQLCSPIVGLAGSALKESGLTPGADYRVAIIGFNPAATAADARRMVDGQIGLNTSVGRVTSALIASPSVAKLLTAAVGYHFVRDADDHRYAHPAALLVVTPDGRLSRVLSGLSINGDDVRTALKDAAHGAPLAILDQIRSLCYGFGASVGRYTNPVRLMLAAAGALTLLAVAGGVGFLVRAGGERRV